MTLLGILFVVGVAFLATMNFEADMISAERQRARSEEGVQAAAAEVESLLRGALLTSPGVTFSSNSAPAFGSAFAEGLESSFSPIEPYYVFLPGGDGLLGTSDDEPVMAWGSVFDPQTGTASMPQGFYVGTQFVTGTNNQPAVNGAEVFGYSVRYWNTDTSIAPVGWYTGGVNLMRCANGPNEGQNCTVPADCNPAGQAIFTCEPTRVADADGDGIVDSVLVDAKKLGMSDAQIADLAARINPPSDLGGKVWVALRVVPHGGMVNLNESHPALIQAAFDLTPALWPAPATCTQFGVGAACTAVDPDTGFRHAPTQDLVSYSAVHEEPLLRRRGIIPPRDFQPSLLHGNPLAADVAASAAHMPKNLFWWLQAEGQQDVFEVGGVANARGHRFTPIAPSEMYPDEPNFHYWSAMMDPATASVASPMLSPWNPDPNTATGTAYDRRHLVTTVSHDNQLARTGTVDTPRGRIDLRQAMIEANRMPPGMDDPDVPELVLPFEYVFYPTADVREIPCEQREEFDCVPKPLEGRMQLSLPWIDEQLDVIANDTRLSGAEANAYRARVYRIIHDVFYMLVRNAAKPVEVEGQPCRSAGDCPFVGTVCLRDNNPPPSPPGQFPANQKGTCVRLDNPDPLSFTNSNPTLPTGCVTTADCAVPHSVCRSDGVCMLSAPGWRDVECVAAAQCNAAEVCIQRCVSGDDVGLICTNNSDCTNGVCGVGLCSDPWTLQRRSEALVSRTAASLTANMIDFVDGPCTPPCLSDINNEPTPIAIRNFDFTVPHTAGREIDIADPPAPANVYCDRDSDCPATSPVCSVNNNCIKPIYVYGLEQQPYITEVATQARNAGTVEARAIELFNPYGAGVFLDDYFIVEVPEGDPFPPTTSWVRLSGVVLAGGFSTAATSSDNNGAFKTDILTPPAGVDAGTVPAGANKPFSFMNNWTVYLVRSLDPGSDNPSLAIVVDQFKVAGQPTNYIGKEKDDITSVCDPDATIPSDPPKPPCRFSVQRVAKTVAGSSARWTWTVPLSLETPDAGVTLGTWNSVANNAIHPVEINFANTGLFGAHFNSAGAPLAHAFPSVGALSLLSRHANRATSDHTKLTGAVVEKNLAFTTQLVDLSTSNLRVEDPGGPPGTFKSTTVDIPIESQIDNGHIPVFDYGKIANDADAGLHYLHHIPPQYIKPWDPSNQASKPHAGDLNTLPWGQLVFDYFTTLPLSNGGPYDLDVNGDPLSIDYMPKVDEGGFRVHGRIDINAAPWKVLSGLPFVPQSALNGLPVPIRTKISGIVTEPTLGPQLAQAIVAYRDARAVTDSNGAALTANYNDGSPPPAFNPNLSSGRGSIDPSPMFRRGNGFVSIGELANVRHSGDVANQRVDGAKITLNPTSNKNDEDFIEAAAVLIALGDWVSTRSDVFTVYGQIRGSDDLTITDPAARVVDTDSRAIRFQETVDRFPVLQGRPRLQRIGERTVGRYTDVNND